MHGLFSGGTSTRRQFAPFIIFPFAIINRSISIDTFTSSMAHVIDPVTGVFVDTRKMKHAVPMTRVAFPLPFVHDASILQSSQSVLVN